VVVCLSAHAEEHDLAHIAPSLFRKNMYGKAMELDTLITTLVLAALLLLAAWQDIRVRQIPDYVVAGLILLGAWRSYDFGAPSLIEIGGVIAISVLLYLVTELIWRSRGVDVLGMGDIKLMLGIGCVVGITGLWITVYLASIGGIAWKVARLFTRKEPLDSPMPFGPFLGIAAFMTWGLQLTW
jgi:prepilin signal peptidase PulO-like enzyme (type II secretory pathway)